MKLLLIRIAVAVVVLLLALQLPREPSSVFSSSGPLTNTPFGVAFDGANIWVGYGQGSGLPAAGVYKL